MENVYEGKDIELFSLPVPRWHEERWRPVLGTAHVVISRDIDEGWVNLGCYRVMVHDKDTLALYISPGNTAVSYAKNISIRANRFPSPSVSATTRCS